MKNIPTINLLTSLLMISQNVSAAYGHLNPSTGESDELFEGTNLCFAETWQNILSDTGNAPDQTSPFLHENTQQHPVDKTNEDRLGQPSSFSYDALRPDDGNDTTQSGLFSMLGTTGSNNSLFGYGAGDAITTGASNVSIGAFSLSSATTASSNTAIGTSTLTNNTSGINNVAIGVSALTLNTTYVITPPNIKSR